MKTREFIYTLDTINEVAEELAQILGECAVVTFSGTLGAGKTTLIQALLKQYAIHDVVQSPTFTYLTTHISPTGETFYHFDLYRLKNLQEFLNAGFEEYLYQPESWALIEWPEIILPILKKRVCFLSLEYHGNDRRRLRITIL